MKQTSRRQFILNTAAVGAGTLLSAKSINPLFAAEPSGRKGFSFEQQPLDYSYDALEPHIDMLTMEIHYSRHAATYCKNVKEAAKAEGVDTNQPIEDVLKVISKYSAKMRNNAGGHFNHELFWKSIGPKQSITEPTGKLADAVAGSFSSLQDLKTQFNDAAKSRFGSGWAWLVLKDKKLVITSTPNQDNPLMDIAEIKGFPVFGLDVWEHAYYLKYQNRRADYIDTFWKIINWEYVSKRFADFI